MSDVPASHPRYWSLKIRDRIVAGVERGVTSIHGLIAHGRGEAFDYLLGESTHDFARTAIHAAAALLARAARPVVSVNGNAVALVGAELVRLARLLNAPLEVNIFHASKERELAIRECLRSHGAADVLMPTPDTQLDFIDSNRKFVNPEGIFRADVIFVPLEDGDRCEALRKMGRDVITVDLNPLSRTARTASITIVDNVVRAMDILLQDVSRMQGGGAAELEAAISAYEHEAILRAARDCIQTGA